MKMFKYLKGKKRNIAAVLGVAVSLFARFFPEQLPLDAALEIRTVVDMVLIGGVADAYNRSGNLKQDREILTGTMRKINPLKKKDKN